MEELEYNLCIVFNLVLHNDFSKFLSDSGICTFSGLFEDVVTDLCDDLSDIKDYMLENTYINKQKNGDVVISVKANLCLNNILDYNRVIDDISDYYIVKSYIDYVKDFSSYMLENIDDAIDIFII